MSKPAPRPQTLHVALIRRFVRSQNRLIEIESLFGPGSRQAEKAIKLLIAFEEDAGSALDAALAACPPERVGVKVSGREAIYQKEDK